MKNHCKHSFEVAIWEYKRILKEENYMGTSSITPTHSVANVFYCKHCLAMIQFDNRKYKRQIKKGDKVLK